MNLLRTCLFIFAAINTTVHANFFDILGSVAKAFGFHPEESNYSKVPNASRSIVECKAPEPDYTNRIKAANQAMTQATTMPGAPHSPLNPDPKQAYKDYHNYKNALSDVSDMFKDASRVVEVVGNICDLQDPSKKSARENSCRVITSNGDQEQWIPTICLEPETSSEQEMGVLKRTLNHEFAQIDCAINTQDREKIQAALTTAFTTAQQNHKKTLAALKANNDTAGMSLAEEDFTRFVNNMNRLYTKGTATVDLPVYPGGYNLFGASNWFKPTMVGGVFSLRSFIPGPTIAPSQNDFDCSGRGDNQIAKDRTAQRACLFPIPDGSGKVLQLNPVQCQIQKAGTATTKVPSIIEAGPFKR